VKVNAPAIEAIASDDYHQNPITYLKVLDSYTRPDNPLLIVETGGGIAARAFFYRGRQLFGHRLRSHGRGLGGSPAGTGYGRRGRGLPAGAGGDAGDHRAARDGEAQKRGRGARHGGAHLIFTNYDVMVRFHPRGRQAAESAGPFPAMAAEPSGRVLIAELGPDEFLIMGSSPPLSSGRCRDRTTPPRNWSPTSKACTRTASGSPPRLARRTRRLHRAIVTLPEAGALVKVKLMRY